MTFDVTIIIVLAVQKLYPDKSVNLINVCSDHSTDPQFLPSLPLLRLPYSLRSNNVNLGQLITLLQSLLKRKGHSNPSLILKEK